MNAQSIATAVYYRFIEAALAVRRTPGSVEAFVDTVTRTLKKGDQVSIVGFGSFVVKSRAARQGRNPKTGEAVALSGKYVPHFKPGKDLRERVNESRHFPIKS